MNGRSPGSLAEPASPSSIARDRPASVSTGRPAACQASSRPRAHPTIDSWPIRRAWRWRSSRSDGSSDDAARADDRGPSPSRATSRTTSRPAIESDRGCGRRRAPRAGRASTTSAPSARIANGSRRPRRRDDRHDPTEETRAGLVDRPHPGEVARERPAGRRAALARTRPRPSAASERVVAPLDSRSSDQGRGPDPGRAQRACAVGRVDRRPKSSCGRIDLVQGAIHRAPRTPERCVGSEQVRPPDGSDEQRAAGEHQDRLVGAGRVGHRVGDVTRACGPVCRGPSRRRPPDLDRVVAAHAAGVIAKLGAGPDARGWRRSGRPAPGRRTHSRCGGGSR